MLLMYMIDNMYDVIYPDMSDLIYKYISKQFSPDQCTSVTGIKDRDRKGLDKILFQYKKDSNGNFINEKLRKKMVWLVNNGYIRLGERFPYITDKGSDLLEKWIKKDSYIIMIQDIMREGK